MFFVSDIVLIKFLPDCREASFVSYIEQLTDVMNHKREQNNSSVIFPSFQKSELYAKYRAYKRSLTNPFLNKWILTRFYGLYPHSSEGFSIAIEGAKGTEGRIKVSLTQIPTVVISSMPRLSPNNDLRCEKIKITALERELERRLEKGVADIIELQGIYLENNGLEKETRLGKPTWIYLREKIMESKVPHQMYTQEKSQGEPSVVYEFAKQSSVVFSLIGDPYVKLKLPHLLSAPNLEQKTIEDLMEAQNQIMGEFLSKCDKILLDAWGKKKFSEMLEPLNVSLDEWLKAGRD
jgi:hypothetical protein